MGIGNWDPSWKGVCTPPEITDSIASKMIKLRSEQLNDSNQESWLFLLKASCVTFSHVCFIPVNQQNIKATVFTRCIRVMRHLPLLNLPHQPHDSLRTQAIWKCQGWHFHGCPRPPGILTVKALQLSSSVALVWKCPQQGIRPISGPHNNMALTGASTLENPQILLVGCDSFSRSFSRGDEHVE